MYKKIIGILVITLLIATTIPTISSITIVKNNNLTNKTSDSLPEPKPDKPKTIGYPIQTIELDTRISDGWGLAFDSTPQSKQRLIVGDYADDQVVFYEIRTNPAGADYFYFDGMIDLSTVKGKGKISKPRGLAYYSGQDCDWLFIVTAYDHYDDGKINPWLYKLRIESNNDIIAEYCWQLDRDRYIGYREAFGLSFSYPYVYVSYDTSNYGDHDQQISHGILAINAFDTTDEDYFHLPGNNRERNSTTYPRAPSWGLASMDIDGYNYQWGTSHHNYIYVADEDTGRGIFYFDSPGSANIYGLTYGKNHLWSLDRCEDKDFVHKIVVDPNHEYSFNMKWDDCHPRHIQMSLDSTANTGLACNAKHIFAQPAPYESRNSQATESWGILDYGGDIDEQYFEVESGSYLLPNTGTIPTQGAQGLWNVTFGGKQLNADEHVYTECGGDVWTSTYEPYVYPHLCNIDYSPPGYDDDDEDPDNGPQIYNLDDSHTWSQFYLNYMTVARTSYGDEMGHTTNVYWVARNILEYILEHYRYGDEINESVGNYKDIPANEKVKLLYDDVNDNEMMACSASCFVMSGACRDKDISTRWIGTTIQRNPDNNDDDFIDWDDNHNGFMDEGESALDTSFHRWPEIWMGERYQWQRWDPTPYERNDENPDIPRELSQFELMSRSCCGVGPNDLVLTVGDCFHDEFYNDQTKTQRYNQMCKFKTPGSWKSITTNEIEWTNNRLIKIGTPFNSNKKITISWSLDGEGWTYTESGSHMWPFNIWLVAKVENMSSGKLFTLDEKIDPYSGLTNLDMTTFPDGEYRIKLYVQDDPHTGCFSETFTIKSKSKAKLEYNSMIRNIISTNQLIAILIEKFITL